MRYIKMLGLAAVAAMALMAFLGASSASASVLCKTTTGSNPCETAWKYGNGTTIHATLEGSAILRDTTSSIVNTCTSSTLSGSLTNGSATVTASGAVTTSGLTFGGCLDEPTTTVTAGALEIHATTDDKGNGTVTAEKVTVTMPFGGISCGFTAGSGVDLGTYTESTKTIHITAVVNKDSNHSGFLCPSTAVWEANYVITSPAGTVSVSTS